MKKIRLDDLLKFICDSCDEDVKESKKAWFRHPRKKKLRKGFVRVTKHGTQIVEPHLHEYPWKIETKTSKRRAKKITEEMEEAGRREAEGVEEHVNRLTQCYI